MNAKIPDSYVSIQIYDDETLMKLGYRSTVSELQLGEDIVQERAMSARSLALQICNVLRKAQKTKAPLNAMTGTVTFELWDRVNGNVTLESTPSYKNLMRRKDAGWPVSNAEEVSMKILRMLAIAKRVERSNDVIKL